ncbi:MptD family putative ECF transporter S component [Corynebacterium sp. zg254]|uniref:MptD family putative ECF transporter S component n=1 Tax=Corynebacterium zhongnanshanii TaxID=2768834 RepID=A0ABQ6VFJ2_9CORY|nr:MptD family putative ECF transporter S component [Corynebacterium zhongnanshanii]MCR5913828.1 MptD family putative ECF transporter S component [Corynebacterium sp. zg254]
MSPRNHVSHQQAANSRLTTRDLINAGIFSALYFVVTFATGMVGFAGPQFMFVGWIIGAIANGIVLALYVARTPKFGALALVGGINGLGFMLTGHYVWTFLGCLLLGLIADLIITKTTLAINKAFPLAYAVFCTWVAMPFIPLILDTTSYYTDIADQMGQQYADAMSNIFQPWTIGALAIGALVVGFIGGIIGVKVSRTHFESAGLL